MKPQNEDYETPMQPITMIRNELGLSHGGSGHPIERKAYAASVEFWRANATFRKKM